MNAFVSLERGDIDSLFCRGPVGVGAKRSAPVTARCTQFRLYELRELEGPRHATDARSGAIQLTASGKLARGFPAANLGRRRSDNMESIAQLGVNTKRSQTPQFEFIATLKMREHDQYLTQSIRPT